MIILRDDKHSPPTHDKGANHKRSSQTWDFITDFFLQHQVQQSTAISKSMFSCQKLWGRGKEKGKKIIF